MNFAIYSSDWTGKSIYFKNLILYAMRLNNVENLKLQITMDKKVNFELYKNICSLSFLHYYEIKLFMFFIKMQF